MKLYYTTSKFSEKDWSYYGLFAQDGDRIFQLKASGLWKEVVVEEIVNYYKTCDKIDIEEFTKDMNEPQKIKLFNRTKGIETKNFYGETILNKSYIRNAVPVICTLPDGGLLCLGDGDHSFEEIVNQQQCSLEIIKPQYTEDGNYTLTDTNTSIVPKDIVEDALLQLEEQFSESENEL